MFYKIALDGPSGAGKSSLAKKIAKELGIVESSEQVLTGSDLEKIDDTHYAYKATDANATITVTMESV